MKKPKKSKSKAEARAKVKPDRKVGDWVSCACQQN